MDVLHVTEELSKKNYSISSLIFFLNFYFKKKLSNNYKILTSFLQTDLFERNDDIKIISLKNFIEILDKKGEIEKIIKKHDVIHVHGIWRAINLLSIFYCIKQKKIFYIHPHGMLLEAALKNKGIINYYLKIIFLYLASIIYSNYLKFISITKNETLSIKKLFNNSQIKFIPNPVPIEPKKFENFKINRRFVYFGRIHPIKNIDLMINGFNKANLSDDWIFEIYGIQDDEKYYNEIKKLSQKNKNIYIKDPVFGLEKENILKTSWSNILLSESEVLSLSVLESARLELPSLVNHEIVIDEYAKNEGIVTKNDVEDVASNIKLISEWDISVRVKKGKKLSKFIDENYSIEKISEKYFPVYKKVKDDQIDVENLYSKNPLNKNIFHNLFNSLFDNSFFQISLSYIFNFISPTLIMLFLTFNKYEVLAADIGLMASIFITITQIFSSNMKARILSSNSILFAKRALIFRLLFSILFLLIFLIFLFNQNFLEEKYISLTFLVCILILFQWIIEIIMSIEEINGKTSSFTIYNLLNSIICFFHIFFIFIKIELLYISLILNLTLIAFLFVNKINELELNFSKSTLLNAFKNNLKTLAFASSLSIIFSSLAWRLIIYYLFDKTLAAIYFSAFAIGSFPGSAFNIAIGPTYIKENINLNKVIKRIILILFFSTLLGAIVALYFLLQNNDALIPNNYFIIYTILFSILGSFFMTYGMYFRQKSIQLFNKSENKVFLVDVIYGIFLTLLCPLLFFIGGEHLTSLTFFFGSLFALLIYKNINLKLNKL